MWNDEFFGKHVFVTGGGRGIGKSVALAFASVGAKVSLISRTADQVSATAAEITEKGAESLGISGDVRDAEQVADAVGEAEGKFGDIDILINAAGMFALGPTVDFADADARELVDTNIIGTFNIIRKVGRGMVERGAGRVVNFASLLSFTSFPARALYGASKGGVLQMTRSIAIEWAPRGVNVNAIAPGMIQVETPHPAIAGGDLSEDAIVGRIPAGRRGKPADIVGPVLFLCSSAADYVYGHTLVVDGGWLGYGYL